MKLRDLPLGSKLLEEGSQMTFLVADQDHYGPDTTALLAEFVIRAGCYDGAEEGAEDKTAKYGSNDYAKSNVAAWLNSDKLDWFQPRSETDQAPEMGRLLYNEMPYNYVVGFLYKFGRAFKQAMAETEIDILARTGPGEGELRKLKTRVFLPSRAELCWGNESGYADGSPLALFEMDKKYLKTRPSDEMLASYGRSWNPGWEFGGRVPSAVLDAPQIYDPKYGWWFWTRTPHLTYEFLVRVRDSYGSLTYTTAYNDIVGIRPLMNLHADTQVVRRGDYFQVEESPSGEENEDRQGHEAQGMEE